MSNIFKAKVILGKGRGRKLGFPTANLDKIDLDIDYGTYAAEVEIKNKRHKGLLHFGSRKTFNEGVSLELYINDFNADIYGQIIEVEIIKKIRETKKFNNIDEFKTQIKKDIKVLKNID